jgi:hypothetical protein
MLDKSSIMLSSWKCLILGIVSSANPNVIILILVILRCCFNEAYMLLKQ